MHTAKNQIETMNPSPVGGAVRDFYKTTTLHGFKYLCSRYYSDRVGWLGCCAASACCAGVLCAVLWARFLQVPALLTLHDVRGINDHVRLPLLAVCPPAETVAHLFGQKFSAGSDIDKRLPTFLYRVLRRKFLLQDQLEVLENFLYKNRMTLQQALMAVVPSCDKIVLNCRWQSNIVSCDKLFKKELTEWGVCCVMYPEKVNLPSSPYESTNKIHIAVQCSDQPEALNGCEFYTRYIGEEWVEPKSLTPGYNYLAQLSFTSVVDKDYEKLIDGSCISAQGYSKGECLMKCREKFCGCRDPIQKQKKDHNVLPTCQMTQLKCLLTFKELNGNLSCKCLSSCKKMIMDMSLESSLMNAINETNDKIYAGLNVSTSSVLRMAIRISGSRIFVVTPTETWITLLSSLGGVFNMFLGVGLFSALEILFLICVRLPIAIRKSTEMDTISAIGQ